MYSIFGRREETIAHVMAECEKLAQKQYMNLHYDKAGTIIHWELCRRYGFKCTKKWYDHIPESVGENKRSAIL